MGASKPDPEIPDPQVRERGRPRTYSAAYKARILEEYDQLDKAGKGARRFTAISATLLAAAGLVAAPAPACMPP